MFSFIYSLVYEHLTLKTYVVRYYLRKLWECEFFIARTLQTRMRHLLVVLQFA